MARYVLSAFSDEAADSLDEQLLALREAGITCMEPRFIDGRGIMTLTDEELCKMKAALDAAGIGLSAIGSPIGKYPITDPFEPHFESFKRACEIAKRLGTPRIRMFSFFLPKDADPAPYRDEVMTRLSAFREYADSVGITLCHENEGAIYGESPACVADVLSSVDGLRGIWDAANYILTGNDPLVGYEATKASLEYIHIKDAVAKDGGRIVPPGDGEGRIAEVLSAHSKTTDATVYLTLEPHLADFAGYSAIDDRNLAGKGQSFASKREAFAYAAAALKRLLVGAGFVESEIGVFTPAE
ncbi:MAG: sugar phosphate isomerase/epimerase [Clostridia bacterium]|nr:sugar phosphate isomerase/epimerase [Clostridia bacterium]